MNVSKFRRTAFAGVASLALMCFSNISLADTLSDACRGISGGQAYAECAMRVERERQQRDTNRRIQELRDPQWVAKCIRRHEEAELNRQRAAGYGYRTSVEEAEFSIISQCRHDLSSNGLLEAANPEAMQQLEFLGQDYDTRQAILKQKAKESIKKARELEYQKQNEKIVPKDREFKCVNELVSVSLPPKFEVVNVKDCDNPAVDLLIGFEMSAKPVAKEDKR
jgi:hypothetical protein